MADAPSPLGEGDRAPDFVLPAADRDGEVSLRDHLGRRPVFLGLFRGLYCAFCRRAVASLGRLSTQLSPLGIHTLAVVATPAHHARVYLKHHPVSIIVGADPAMATHAAYGLPKIPKERGREYRSIRINPTGELPAPLPIPEANEALGQLDLFTPTDTDREDMQRTWNQLHGLFLIDRTGIIRWVFVEASDGLAAIGRYPTEAELVTVARTLRE